MALDSTVLTVTYCVRENACVRTLIYIDIYSHTHARVIYSIAHLQASKENCPVSGVNSEVLSLGTLWRGAVSPRVG